MPIYQQAVKNIALCVFFNWKYSCYPLLLHNCLAC
jgi:hypothetical protein